MQKIVLAGGGTGGHITPLRVLARALESANKDLELHLVSEGGAIAKRMLAIENWQLHTIKAGKWRRYPNQTWWQRLKDARTFGLNVIDVFKLGAGVGQAFRLLRRLKPAAVFVKGGYVGLPVGVAAWLLRVPLIIHESDIRPGLTNRVLAHLADTVATGWPKEHYPQWQHKHLLFTGNIVEALSAKTSQASARQPFKLKAGPPVLLVIGGSQGARALNQAVLGHLEAILTEFQVIHIAGPKEYAVVSKNLSVDERLKSRYHLYDFLDSERMALAYQASEVVLSRASANVIAEIAAIGRAVIAVPNPHSTSGHQVANARVLDQYDAAILLTEPELNKKLMQILLHLKADAALRRQLAKNLVRLAAPQGASALAKEILRFNRG